MAATHGQLGDALGGHIWQTSAVSWGRFSSNAERSAWQSWLEAMRGSDTAVLAENQQDVQQEKILIMDLQWSNTFYLSPTWEEGPKWIHFWEPGFRHSFIAPRQDFKAVMNPALALGSRAEQALPHPSLLRQNSEPWNFHGAEDGHYSHGNAAPPEAWLFGTNFSR